MYAQGESRGTIAEHLGVKKRSVSRYLSLACPEPLPRSGNQVTLRSFYMEGACGKHPELNWASQSLLMQARVKAVCWQCPVLAKCRNYGLPNGRNDIGVWGAMTANERQREIRRRQSAGSRPDRDDIAGVA